MQTIQIPAGSTSQSVFIRVTTDADNLIAQGEDYSTLPLVFWFRDGEAVGFAASTELSALSDAWQSAGVIEAGYGWYRLDIPNAALASGADRVIMNIADAAPGSQSKSGSVSIELTNVPTAFSGSAKRDVRSR